VTSYIFLTINEFTEEKKHEKILWKKFGGFRIDMIDKPAFHVLVRQGEEQTDLFPVSKTLDAKHKTAKNFRKYHLTF